ncbi:MAG: autotransporter-associated beta strand repeat-containing protein, partial [Gemmataceae bacterium]|nr:autotransporter-associated beta strand repeat-containing protein [Gemmataceae bacterium]
MPFAGLRRLVRFQSKSRSSVRRKPNITPRPRVELLEARELLATRIWTGAGPNVNWSTAANWQGNVAPVSGDDLVFPAGAARLANTNNISPATAEFRSIRIEGSGYNIGGTVSTLLLTNGITAVNTTGTNTFRPGTFLFLTGAQTIAVAESGATLTITSQVDLAGGALTVAGAGTLNLTDQVFGPSGIVKTGAGTLNLSGNNLYQGATTINAGTVTVLRDNALGLTNGITTVAAGATLNLQVADYPTPEPITINGTGVGGSGALRTPTVNSTFAGPVTLGSASTINAAAGSLTLTDPLSLGNAALTVTGPAATILQGAVAGTGSLTYAGTGTLTLAANNTYTGATTIASGTVLVNGTMTTSTVNLTGGTLGGTGRTGPINGTGGTVSPGSPSGNPGVLNTTGNVVLNVASSVAVQLNGTAVGTGYDQLN